MVDACGVRLCPPLALRHEADQRSRCYDVSSRWRQLDDCVSDWVKKILIGEEARVCGDQTLKTKLSKIAEKRSRQQRIAD